MLNEVKHLGLAMGLALLLVAAPLAAADSWNAWHNVLKPTGQGHEITLVKDGQAQYSIVIAENASPPEHSAATELARWIKQITGAELSIGTTPGAGGAVRIASDASFAPEKYSIAISGQDLVLTGAPGRGVLDVVYALLEEDMGCRWY